MDPFGAANVNAIEDNSNGSNVKETETVMNIALDVMGGDNAPKEIVAGAVDAARVYGVTVSLVGPPDIIRAELANYSTAGLNLPIIPAEQVIEMGEKPVQAVRNKPDSSIVVATKMVRKDDAQAFVTAGNTGAALTAGTLYVGRVRGILRPALVIPFPTRKGFCAVLDIGANADTKPEHMQQFGVMGSIYAQHVMNVERPVVRLLSNGEEAGKGNQLILNAYDLLQRTKSINFQGNVESIEVMEGLADVVVTDGFTGNIFIKTSEGVAKMLQAVMKEELTRGPVSTLGAFLAQAGLRRVRARLDDSQYGGAILLGLKKPVIVTHGRSKANAIRHAIRVAKQAIEQDLSRRIQQGVTESIDLDQTALMPVSS